MSLTHPRLRRVLLAAPLGVLLGALVTGCSDDEPDGPAFSAVAGPTSQAADSGPESDLWSTGSGSGAGAVTCGVGERTPAPAGSDWSHPSRSFYTGSERRVPTDADLEHLMEVDAAVVVRYRADLLPQASLDVLRGWVETTDAAVGLPAADAGAQGAAVQVDLLDQQLLCDGVDTLRLAAFAGGREAVGDHDDHQH